MTTTDVLQHLVSNVETLNISNCFANKMNHVVLLVRVFLCVFKEKIIVFVALLYLLTSKYLFPTYKYCITTGLRRNISWMTFKIIRLIKNNKNIGRHFIVKYIFFVK